MVYVDGFFLRIREPTGSTRTEPTLSLHDSLTIFSARLGTNVAVAYFDQMRAQLDEDATLADVISPGSEWVEIGGARKHVMSYLGDFLFSPARAGSPVRSLSGGERARLLLARLFARPAHLLVLETGRAACRERVWPEV